jgi:hypothetical protein
MLVLHFLGRSFKNMHLHRFLSRAVVAVLMVAALSAGASAYVDAVYNYSVTGPSGWMPLRTAAVPGLFRFGWLARDAAQNRSGASVVTFVQLTEYAYSVQELLDQNKKAAAKRGFKVVRASVINQGPHPAFVFEVVGDGTGYSILPPKVDRKGIMVLPTRQRWLSVVRGKQIVTVLSTCANDRYGSYAPIFSKVEKSLSLQ